MSTAILSPLGPFGLPAPLSLSASLRRLRTDDRGAIMVLGLFLALFLIGALWFLIGVGDMVVYRDKAQEAADAASFSVTVVHAKGMNLIAALNLLMLVMTAIYIAIGIVRDVVYISAVATCWTAATPPQWAACAAKVTQTHNVHNAWKGYSKVFRKAVEAMGAVQTVTAYVAPHLGQAAGMNVGRKHKFNDEGFIALSMSSSMIPGGGEGGAGGAEANAPNGGAGKIEEVKNGAGGFQLAGSSGKLGLPVSKAQNDALCSALFSKLGTMINGKFGGGGIAGWLGGLISKAVGTRYCSHNGTVGVSGWATSYLLIDPFDNDAFDGEWWEKKTGPKKMFSPAENGTDWMQTWTFVSANYKDKNVRQVGMAGYDFTKTSQAEYHLYTAQSEMFFDCGETWENDDCNGDGEDDVSLALYAMNWRSRLVRVRQGNITGVLGDFFLQKIFNGGIFDSLGGVLKDWMGNQAWVQDIVNKVGGKVGVSPETLNGLIGSGVDKGVDAVEGQVGDWWGGANALPATENYH